MGALDSIRQKIQQEAMAAITEAESKGKIATENNVHSFYSSAGTGRYKRTGQLGDSTRSTGVSGGGNHYTARIYLDVAGVSYKVPNPAFSPPYASYFSAQDVFNAAELVVRILLVSPDFGLNQNMILNRHLLRRVADIFLNYTNSISGVVKL